MKLLLLIAHLATADTACTVPVADTTVTWKQVTTESVTFCVPSTWRVRGTRASYSGGSIRWQNTASQGTARQPSGPQNISGGMNPNSTPLRTESLPETIGGRQATVMRQYGVGRIATSVVFTQPPPFSITGEASGDEHAALQLAVYRTIRFKAPE